MMRSLRGCMGGRVVLTWGCLLVIFWAGLARAEELQLFKGERFQGGPWHIRAEKIIYDAPRHTYEAQGQVDIRQGTRSLMADRVQVNEITKIAQVQGHVVLIIDDDIFTGREGYFNLATRDGEMRGARLFIKRNHFHVDSELMRKTGEHSYYAEKATVTTCDADRPTWTFSTRNLNVVLDGYATGKDAVVRLGGVPMLYLPYSVLPVRTERQSGFLMPNFGQHRLGGTVFELPFYWAINNYSDATLYQTLITDRGYLQGVEYRYAGYREAAANLRFSYINDTSGIPSTNHRYWAAGMLNQPLGEWSLRASLDKASDAAYLTDFNWGYMGLTRYSNDLEGQFGRNLEQQEVDTRVSNLLLSRNFPWANFTAYSRYYERLRSSDPYAFNQLPGLALNTLTWPLGAWPFLLGMDSSFVNYYQVHGSTGTRLDFHPQLWCQARPVTWINLDSRVGFRETAFSIDQHGAGSPSGDYLGRQLYDTKVSLSSPWVRDYGRETGSVGFYRHILQPEVTYWNMPLYNAARYPDFDPWDKGWVDQTSRNLPVREGDNPLGGVNALTYGFSSNLLRRGQTAQGLATVDSVLWFRLSQSAFFNSSSMGLDGTPLTHHRFSDFLAETEFYPLRQLTMGVEMGVSPYYEGFERANLRFTFFDKRRQNYLSVGYLFLKDFANQIYFETYLDLLRSMKVWLTNSYALLNGNRMEQRYGVVLQRQCWGVSITYTDRPGDNRVGFIVFIPEMGEKLKKSPVRMPEKEQM